MKKTISAFFVLAALLALPTGHAVAGGMGFAPKFSIYADSAGVDIKAPEGVACRGDIVVVADSGNGRLLKFAYENGLLAGGAEIKPAQLGYPVHVQFDSKGDILVLDGRARRVVRLGPDGAFKGNVDPQGLPTDVAPAVVGFKTDQADNIFMLDMTTRSVIETDPAGKFIKKMDYPAGVQFISDLCIDQGGNVYLVDPVGSTVYAQDKATGVFAAITKDIKTYMNFPMYITSDDRGALYVMDQHGSGLVLLGSDGSFQGRLLSMGWSEGLVYYPSQICMDGKGTAYIADRGNNRIGVFSVIK